jgi:hypothetical protein
VLDVEEAPDESTIGSKSDLSHFSSLALDGGHFYVNHPSNLRYCPTNSCSQTRPFLRDLSINAQLLMTGREAIIKWSRVRLGRHLAPGGRGVIEWVESPPSIIRSAKHQH